MSWSYGVLETRQKVQPGTETFPVEFIEFDTGAPTAFEDIVKAFRGLGAEDWELVSVIVDIDDEQDNSTKVTRHFFKRPGSPG